MELKVIASLDPFGGNSKRRCALVSNHGCSWRHTTHFCLHQKPFLSLISLILLGLAVPLTGYSQEAISIEMPQYEGNHLILYVEPPDKGLLLEEQKISWTDGANDFFDLIGWRYQINGLESNTQLPQAKKYYFIVNIGYLDENLDQYMKIFKLKEKVYKKRPDRSFRYISTDRDGNFFREYLIPFSAVRYKSDEYRSDIQYLITVTQPLNAGEYGISMRHYTLAHTFGIKAK